MSYICRPCLSFFRSSSGFRLLTPSTAFSSSASSSSALSFLIEEKGIPAETAEEIISLFRSTGTTPTRSSLSQMGDAGLQQLKESIERELKIKKEKEHSQQKIQINIHNPREKSDKVVAVFIKETLLNTSLPLTDDLEYACGGNAACSTCHVIVDPVDYDKLSPPEEDELDMLDLAWGPTPTSRLACQMVMNKNCDNMRITIPTESHNLF